MIRKKRIIFFVLFVCFSLFGIKMYDAYAANGVLTFDYVNSWIIASDHGNPQSAGKTIRVNGLVAYCIEPGVEISYGKTYEQVSFSEVGLNQKLAKRLSLIGAYGYGYLGRTDSDWEAITQGLIWKEMGADRYFFTNSTNTKEKLEEKWNEILYDVDRYYVEPNFNETNVNIKVNQEIILNDNNLVLNDMEIVSNGGLDVRIQNNQLIIKASNTTDDEATIILRKKIPQEKNNSSYWYHSQWQKLASFSVSDEVSIEIKVEIEKNGKLKIQKQNQYQELIDGTVVKIFNDSFEKEITIHEGEIEIDELEQGIYNIQEIQAPMGYLLDSTIYQVEIFAGETTAFTLNNKEPTGILSIKKIDGETTVVQGDGSLSSAKYGLYAKEDIYNASKKVALFKKDELVGTLITDENANATLENIPMGNYYLKEITASIGYQLDGSSYDVSFTYQNQTFTIIKNSLKVKENVIKRPLKIIKISSNSTEIAEGVENVVFEIKLKSEVEQVGYENALTYDTLTTNQQGEAISVDLPFGMYIVKEISTPSSFIPIEDFEIEISESTQEPLQYVINNQGFEAYIKIVKKDMETKQTILCKNTTFKLFDLDNDRYIYQKIGNQKIDSFTTNELGVVTTPLKLPYGNYRIEEIEAPYGYLLNQEGYAFKAEYYSKIELDEDGDYILVFEVFNQQVKGRIEVLKSGEVLTGYQNEDFVYETKGLAGATFELFAADIIYSSDTKQIIYEKNESIMQGISNEEGKVMFSDLPLGKYYIKEIKAPLGYLALEEEYIVELTYENQLKSVVTTSISMQNIRKPILIDIYKIDSETKQPLSNVEFGIYNQEEIKDNQGNVIVPKDSLIEIIVTDNDGKANNQKDLPLNEYYVKELKAALGYVKDDSPHLINETMLCLENTITTIDISKIDVTTSDELEGASLQLKDSQGNIVEEWISTSTPYRIKGLYVGETYTLIEVIQPYGFSISNEISFVIDNTADIQKVEMYDDLKIGQLNFIKEGETFTKVEKIESDFGIIYQPIFEQSSISDAEITIYAAEDIILGNGITYFKKNQEVTVVSSLEQTSETLLVGKYYAIETKVPYGYVQDNTKHYFEIVNDGDTISQNIYLNLLNHKPTIQLHIKKVLENNDLLKKNSNDYKDVVFGFYTKEDILDDNGEVLIEKDRLVAISTIDENGDLNQEIKLPYGSYYMKELKTSDHYLLSDEIYYFTIDYLGKDVSEYHIYLNDGLDIVNSLKRSNIGVLKVDSQDEALQLGGATFVLYDQEYQPLLTSISDYQGFAYMENIPYGTYYVKESIAPINYLLNDTYYEVKVDENFDQNNYVFLTIANDRDQPPASSDSTSSKLYMHLTCISGVLIILVLVIKYRYKLLKK